MAEVIDELGGASVDFVDAVSQAALGSARAGRIEFVGRPSLAPSDPAYFPWHDIDIEEAALNPREWVVQANGQARQAGASQAEGEFLKRLKQQAESRLYVFAKAIMGRGYLTKRLHLPLCDGLQRVPPFRKMRLLPRDHAKTSVISHCLPPHILIQPAASNLYFKGLAGTECRIMLAGETEGRATSNLRVIETAFEGNQLLRALWPESVWEEPRRQAKKWNDKAFILPRENEYPDPSVFAIGVGGAVTGARPNVIIKDDLVSIAAANSDVVMRDAIEWHKASRALMDEYEKDTGQESLEYIIGTRWATFDLYSYIMQGDDEAPADPTVDIEIRAIIEDGAPLWPERFDDKRIEQLKAEFGSMFWLLYMNTASDASLVDFSTAAVRSFQLRESPDGLLICFDESMLDEALVRRAEKGEGVAQPPPPRGQPLNARTWAQIFGSREAGESGRERYMKARGPCGVRLRAA